ncbi:MAG: hypothetical protein LBE02_03550 [Spirochaetaceae bacterium]|jgi:hypothetical protein|nr:hypothetical protein [Spirochaetaceae bacterium]
MNIIKTKKDRHEKINGVIFFGYPNWRYSAPMELFSFIELENNTERLPQNGKDKPRKPGAKKRYAYICVCACLDGTAEANTISAPVLARFELLIWG